MNIGRLDLRLLQCLDALVTERHVSRAATRVHLSQPAMSSALKRLREILKDPLLTRTQRGLVPTPHGIELAQSARAILHGVEAMASETRRFEPMTSERTFHIAMTDYSEFVLLPLLVRRLQIQAPNINVAVTPLDRRTHADELLTNGDIDLAISNFPDVSGRLRTRELFHERFVCLASKRNAKVGKRLTLAKFTALSHAFISPHGGGFYGATDDALAASNRARRIAVSVPHFLIAPFLVANTDLIIVMAERVARHFASTLPLRLLEAPVRIEGFTVSQRWHERSDHDTGMQWLRALIMELNSERPKSASARAVSRANRQPTQVA
jgi:DNA-binding transcriptional LysR family regulator